MRTTAVPGLAVSIVKNGKVVRAQGLGSADFFRAVDMTADTPFLVASLSKLVVNAAILQLWEQGRIELDDDVNAYLPFVLEHPLYPDEAITIRHLLTHRGSLRDNDVLWNSYVCGDPNLSVFTQEPAEQYLWQ